MVTRALEKKLGGDMGYTQGMKILNCSICGVRVDIPSHASAYVGHSVVCPSCLAKRSRVGKAASRFVDEVKASPWIAWMRRRRMINKKPAAITPMTRRR